MSQVRVAPYGSWKSPITSDVVIEGAVGLSEIALDGGDVYWLEARPAEGRRRWNIPRDYESLSARLAADTWKL